MRVGFGAKNGDCCGESAVTHAQVRAFNSPCKAPFLSPKSCREQLAQTSTQSPNSSSTILESKSVNKKQAQAQKSNREQVCLESKSLDFSSSSSRAAQSGVAIHSPNTQKLESSMDCHADFQSARNDSNNAPTLNEPAKDSRIFDNKAPTISKSQAEGFCDDFLKKPAAALPCTATAGFVGCAWRGVGEGIYLSGNEQAHAADSRKSAQNKRSGASVSSQVSLEKPTPPLASDYMEYYMFDEPAWNTFDPQVAQNSLGKLQRIVKVPLLTLGEVLHTYVPKGVEIDFLSIDCEGFDLAVLESNDWDSFVPHIIIVEILTNIYGELDMVALQDNEIARFLFSKGYALVAKAHNSVIFQHKDRR